MNEPYDPADARQAIAAVVRERRRKVREASADLTFAVVEDSLADSDLVAAFGLAFESMAFASFEITGVNVTLTRTLKSVGNRCSRFLDPYAHRLLASEAMRTHLPELAIDEADAIADPDFAVFEVVDPLLLEGSLAVALHDGGPYSDSYSENGTASVDAHRLANDFRAKLIGDRFDDLCVVTGHGWTDWFGELGWDHGWLMTDLRTARVHLLCASGND